MTHKKQTNLTFSSFGRIILHLGSFKRDHKLKFHFQGIKREIVRTSLTSH